MRVTSLLLALLPLPAAAACPAGDVVFTCQIGSRAVALCHAGDVVTYSFGPPASPELTLSQPLAELDFTPWPGIGSAIWERVAFANADHVYEVWTSVLRDPDATTGLQGGINVMRDTRILARLTCDAGSVSNSLDVIFDLKTELGQCWDFDRRSWAGTCD